MRPWLSPVARQRLRSSRGANLIEAAVVSPLLLLLTFSIADFALLFLVWLALHNGASQATRFAVTGRTTGSLTQEESIKQAMRDATPLFAIPDSAFTFAHMRPGGTSWIGGVGGPNEIGKVTITYTWTLLTPLVKPFFTGGEMRFVVESAMKNEPRIP